MEVQVIKLLVKFILGAKKDGNINFIDNNIGEKYFDLIRIKSLWEEYTYDAKSEASRNDIKSKMKVLDSPIKIQIPSKENVRYLHIKNFQTLPAQF